MYFPLLWENIGWILKAICLGLLEGQEDCLYINVYRPEADEEEAEDEQKELLPVSFSSAKKKIHKTDSIHITHVQNNVFLN